jgi:Domain of unknown function (DUF1707)
MSDADDGPVSEPEQAELVQALRRHLADGRLDIEQFDVRVARVYGARTRAQARRALDDLPLLGVPSTDRRSRRRHGESGQVQPHWVATEELFRDPATGRVMRVWIDPTSGARHYAEAGP